MCRKRKSRGKLVFLKSLKLSMTNSESKINPSATKLTNYKNSTSDFKYNSLTLILNFMTRK
jgi:hypothetical protein